MQHVVSAGLGEWATALGLVFGGCCSNALTLEVVTAQHAKTGTLITFAQYLFITISGLRRQLVVEHPANTIAFHRVCETHLPKLPTKPEPLDSILMVRLASPNSAVAHNFIDDLRSYLSGRYPYLSCTIIQDEWPDSGFDPALLLSNGNSDMSHSQTHSMKIAEIKDTAKQTGPPDLVFLVHGPKITLHSTNEDPVSIYKDRIALQDPHASPLYTRIRNLRFKRRHVPLMRYLAQVLIFLCINLLNNIAFAYHIPMTVHIIFRSGGLVVNMILGRLFNNRRYSTIQLASVLLVTIGIGLTTLSSTQSKPSHATSYQASSVTQSLSTPSFIYFIGICILTLALVLSGFLGILQDRTFSEYGRGNWEESMFYLHSLALPMFGLLAGDIKTALKTIDAGPKIALGPQTLFQALSNSNGSVVHEKIPPIPWLPVKAPTLIIPQFYVPLLLNLITQTICVAGVNRLTVTVSSLTVTLILAVRKAVSLAISVMLMGNSRGNLNLAVGSAAVLLGTVGYAMASREGQADKKEKTKTE